MAEPEYRDRLKTTILMVARTILAEEGLAGLQARRVATGANCSVGTIYNLFGNLDTVTISANAGTLKALQEELLEARRNVTGSLEERLVALAMTYLNFAVEQQHSWRAIFEHRMPPDTEVPGWYRDAQMELFAIVEEVLAPFIPEHDKRREAARALFSATHGVVAMSLDQKLGEFDRAATSAQLSFIVRSVARGIDTPAG